MKYTIDLQSTVSPNLENLRLDQALAHLFPRYSRSQLQTWIRAGHVTLEGQLCTNIREKVLSNQKIKISASLSPQERWEAQAIPLDIVYEDSAILVINKPPGLVVHPGAGVPNNTLVNALLYHAPELSIVPRAGIIHRLDKNTSGLLVIARTLSAHHALIQQMKKRHILREYEAIVFGTFISGGSVEAPIGRHPIHRTRMAVIKTGKPAVTHYRIITRYPAFSHVCIRLETGRTHQIRVHMAYIRHPIVGDRLYGAPTGKSGLKEPLKMALFAFQRQALHAVKLALQHPTTHKPMTWIAPLPQDMVHLLAILKQED